MATKETIAPGFRCIVSADLFRRAAACMSKEYTRYYLQGVRIEPCDHGGALLISTDGRSLVVVRDRDAVVEGAAIVQPSAAVLKACRKHDGMLKVNGKGQFVPLAVVVAGDRLAVTPRPTEVERDLFSVVSEPDESVVAFQWAKVLIDGTYPDWRRVVPNVKAAAPGSPCFDPDIVRSLRDALGRPGHATVSLFGDDPSGPHLALGDGVVSGFGVVMPISPAANRPQLPGWFAQPKQKQAA